MIFQFAGDISHLHECRGEVAEWVNAEVFQTAAEQNGSHG